MVEYDSQKRDIENKVTHELLPEIHKTELLTTEIKIEIHDY